MVARKYFDETTTYAHINAFVRNRDRENIYLDFKILPCNTDETPDENKLKEIISTAAGGFAHQEGGVIIWGVEAKSGKHGDCAQKLIPIKNLEHVVDLLIRLGRDAVSPRLKIEHIPIYLNNNKSNNIGFIKSFFPISDDLHVSEFAHYNFYQRLGDEFFPMRTKDQMQTLLNRKKCPKLEIYFESISNVYKNNPDGSKTPSIIDVSIKLKNTGQEVAEFPSIYLRSNSTFSDIYDSTGNYYFPIGKFVNDPRRFSTQFISNPGFVIHPSQEIGIGQIKFSSSEIPEISYKIFAKNMIPVEGTVNLPPLFP